MATQNEREFEAVWSRWANSPEGRWALEEARKRRSYTLFSNDPLELARRVGALEVIIELQSYGIGGDA